MIKYEQWIKECEKRDDYNEYEILSEYKNTYSKILIRHKICGNEYYQEAKSFKNGYRCKKCSAKIGGEKKDILKNNGKKK